MDVYLSSTLSMLLSISSASDVLSTCGHEKSICLLCQTSPNARPQVRSSCLIIDIDSKSFSKFAFHSAADGTEIRSIVQSAQEATKAKSEASSSGTSVLSETTRAESGEIAIC